MKQKLRVFLTLLLCAVASVGWGQTTYKLQQVTSVEKGGLYVFEQNGHVAINSVASSALQTTDTYNTSGLTGSEAYVWELKNGTNGYIISSKNKASDEITNSSKGNISLTATGTSWTFSFSDGVALIQNPNNDNRFLGYSGATNYQYKAYAYSNLDSYPHAIKVYKLVEEGGDTPSPEDNDLALSTTSLVFDLYNDASAKTIRYTTSSTGAVTVSASEYVTTEVNETNKTITVTPKSSVTPSAQTITVSQAADDTYAAGSATFTVTIDDSTPVTATNWEETDLTNIEDGDIFVIVGNNGNNFALANDQGTSSAPTAVAVTVNRNYITGNVADNIKWNVSGNATDGYTFYPNGNTTAWLYTTNTNNGVRVGTNDNKTFTIDKGYLKNSGTSRYVGIYDSQDWRCYTSYTTANIANQTFKFYKYIGAPEPTISANNVEIAYNITSGSIGYTIGNPADGTLTATEDADWLTIGTITSDEVPFTVTPNTSNAPRTANVTLTYTYGESIVSKNVTVTQAAAPATLMTIAEVRVQSLGSNVKTSGIVTSVNGQNVYMQDATAAIVVYGENSLTKGDNITVEGKLATFNGLLEIQNAIVTVNSQGNTVEPVVKTIAEINTDDGGDKALQAMLVKIENATVTAISGDNTTISQGDNSIVVYKITGAEYGVDDILTLTGNVGYHNKAQIVNATDITVQDAEQKYTVNIGTLTHVTSIDLWDGDMEDIADGSEVTPGTLVYAKPNVETGYTLKTITAVDADNNNIDLDENNGSWSFTMPNSSVTISATAEKEGGEPSGDKYVKVTSTSDLTNGQYLIVYEEGSVAFNGGLETLDAVGNTIEVTLDNNEIVATEATTAAEFTIDVTAGTLQSASGQYIGVSSNSNGLKQTDNAETYTHTFSIDTDGNAVVNAVFENSTMALRYNKTSGQTRFRYFKNAGQEAIQLYKKVSATPQPETIKVNISAVGMATFSSVNALDFTDVDNIYAYTATINGDKISFTRVYQVPAETGLLLRNPNGDAAEAQVPVISNATAVENNALVAVDTEIVSLASEETDGTKNYILNNGSKGIGFYKAAGKKVGAGKAYLQVPASVTVREFIGFDDETDGIRQIENGQLTIDNAEIYNLSGQRVNKAQKGIYIVNGKKVVVK